jgi:hypothetical protein
MAITLNNEPEAYHPVYQPMWFSVSSNNYTQPNFKFICDVHVREGNGTNRGKIAQLKFLPVPGTDYGKINVAGVLKSYITHQAQNTANATSITATSGHILQYDVKFGEEYGPSSGITQYPNLTTSLNKYAWNGAPRFEKHLFISGTQYSTTSPQNLLSYLNNDNFDTAKPVASDEEDFINFMEGSTSLGGVKILTYGANQNYLDFGIIWDKFKPKGVGNRFMRCAIGPANINGLTATDWRFTPSNDPMITASVKYYRVCLVNNSFTETSNAVFFEIVDKCTKDTAFDFQFLNGLGGYECFRFTGAYQINDDIQKSEFKKVHGSWNTTSEIWGDAYSDRAKSYHSVVSRKKFKVYSDWITEDQSQWLRDLMRSIDVRVKWPNPLSPSEYYWIPVQVLNSTYIEKREASDRLFNIEMEFEFTVQDYSQQW